MSEQNSNYPLEIDLLMGPFRGAVFHHGGVPENCPLALTGSFPSLMGCFLTVGPFPRFRPKGPFSLLKIPCKTAPFFLEKGH